MRPTLIPVITTRKPSDFRCGITLEGPATSSGATCPIPTPGARGCGPRHPVPPLRYDDWTAYGRVFRTARACDGRRSRIGAACALALAEAGATVVTVARSGEELDALAERIAERGGRSVPVAADLRDPLALAAAVDPDAAGGVVSICVHAAGVNRPMPTVDMEIDDWEHVVDANLRGTFVVCQAVGRRLLAAGRGGAIVTISSQMGVVGYPGRAAYCASKHGVNGLTKALAVEWASDGIRVNAVAPTSSPRRLPSSSSTRPASARRFSHACRWRGSARSRTWSAA